MDAGQPTTAPVIEGPATANELTGEMFGVQPAGGRSAVVDGELQAAEKAARAAVAARAERLTELAAARQGALQVWLQHAVESRGEALALLHFLGLAGDRKSGW